MLRSAPTPRTGEASASSELAALVQRVAQLDSLGATNAQLKGELEAAKKSIRELEGRTVSYPFLQDEHARLQDELATVKRQLGEAEEQNRLSKPVRDALVKELQVRPDTSPAALGNWD